MERTEFFLRQAERFENLARECTDRDISAKVMAIAAEYRDMLNGKAPPADRKTHICP